MGVSESSLAWFFPLEKWFQSFKLLTRRPILAHLRCKQQGAVSRGRAVSRFRPPAWSATTADLAQKPPAWSAPRSRPAAFARNQPLSRSRPAAWSATLRGPGTRSSGIPLLLLYYNHNQSTDPCPFGPWDNEKSNGPMGTGNSPTYEAKFRRCTETHTQSYRTVFCFY